MFNCALGGRSYELVCIGSPCRRKKAGESWKVLKEIFDTLPRIQITSPSEFIDSETASNGSSIRCRALFALTKRDEFFMNFSEQINVELVNALQ